MRNNKPLVTFNPEFTYPIFGQEEAIFGYQGLDISLAFAAHNLKPHLEVKWDKQFPEVGDIKATGIKGALADFLPASALTSQKRSEYLQDGEDAAWKPPGQSIKSYTVDGTRHEIYVASLADPAARELLENMQVLVPLFIEGGSALELDHDWSTERWKIFFIYQHQPSTDKTSPAYSLVGYGTSYRVFTFPDRENPDETATNLLKNTTPIDDILTAWSHPPSKDATSPLALPSRERLSQFLILPPYQGFGHGAKLYNTMYAHLTAESNILEFTVEDPNEAFDDLRDVCDLLHLRATYPEFAELKINTSVPAQKLRASEPVPSDEIIPVAVVEKIRKGSKIMPRQLARLLEMQTLAHIPALHRSTSRITRKEKSSNEMDKAYFFWRLYVKQRLYVFNRDALAQLDREERVEKLEATVENVLVDYERLLELAEKRGARGAEEESGSGGVAVRRGKRKVVVDEDEDEDDEDDDAEDGADGKEAEEDDGEEMDEDEDGVDVTDALEGGANGQSAAKRRKLA